MFGVVPKVMWSKLIPVDEYNCIPQATNCVLVQTGRQNVLIDTGYGSKLRDKERALLAADPGDPIVDNLKAKGLSPDDIDLVILSHLHFDHAGGGIRLADEKLVHDVLHGPNTWCSGSSGKLRRPAIRSCGPPIRWKTSRPWRTPASLRLVDGDVEIMPGIVARITGGHTNGQQALFIESEGQTAVYLADACPTWRHLPSLWCMSYDMDLLQSRRIKPLLLGEIADRGWLALFDHDPDHAAARLRRDPDREFAVAEAIREL